MKKPVKANAGICKQAVGADAPMFVCDYIYPQQPVIHHDEPEFDYSETGTDENGRTIYGVHEGRYILWFYEDGSSYSAEFNPCPVRQATDAVGRVWSGYENTDGTYCWIEER
nr:hypothetical protein [uncultured Butyrivibrio sp.]